MGTSLLERVAGYSRRHGLLGSAPVLAMVSGGADSLTLMHLLREICTGEVMVLSIDHGLRADGAGEAESVREAAVALGLRAEVRALALAPGSGLQERARDARYDVARTVARELGCDRVATGHTASDNAETILFRLARGTGRTGALGMAPRARDLIRPLLCVTREETAAFCQERRLSPASDPSNSDPRFARARVRDGLLAALADVHPGAERHVAAFADVLRDEAELLDAQVDSALSRASVEGGLDVALLTAEPDALARMVLRRVIAAAGGGGEAMAGAAVDRAMAVAAGDAPRAELPGGVIVTRSRDRLLVTGPRTAATWHSSTP